jgi:hypothetical protein
MTLISLPGEAERRSLWNLAKTLTAAPNCPKTLRGNPVGALQVMMYGRELGMGPMTALSQIDLISGNPTLSPQGMNSLIRGGDSGHRLAASDVSDHSVTVTGVRGDTGEEFSYTYTLEDAQRAGLVREGTWKEYPALMLMARATGVVCRFLFADVLGPVSYSAEELGGSAEALTDLTAFEADLTDVLDAAEVTFDDPALLIAATAQPLAA